MSEEPLEEPIQRLERALANTPERIALRNIGETFEVPEVRPDGWRSQPPRQHEQETAEKTRRAWASFQGSFTTRRETLLLIYHGITKLVAMRLASKIAGGAKRRPQDLQALALAEDSRRLVPGGAMR